MGDIFRDGNKRSGERELQREKHKMRNREGRRETTRGRMGEPGEGTRN